MVKITNTRYRNVFYEFDKGEKLSDVENILTTGFPVGICPKCGELLIIKKGKYGKFIACEGFKTSGCKNTYKINNFKTAFKFEVSKIPSKIKMGKIHWSLYKRD